MAPTEHYRTSHPYGNGPPIADISTGNGVRPPPVQDPPMQAYRGAQLGQPFDLRARIKASRVDDKPMMGCWLGAFPYPEVARTIAQVGYEYVVLDWEHTAMGIREIGEIIKWINYAGEGKTAVVVRVPDASHVNIARVLDAGASGVILPHCETAADAQELIKAARSPPEGTRSWGPNNLGAGFNDGPGFFEVMQRAAVICQIESKDGAAHADEIAAVKGVDGLMIGPGDLALDIGITLAQLSTSAEFIECNQKIAEASKKYRLGLYHPCGFNPAMVPKLRELGATMFTVGNDQRALYTALRSSLEQAWSAVRG